MKIISLKMSVLLQTLLLFGVIGLGLVLKLQPIGGPREFHELFGFAAGLVSLGSFVLSVKEKQTVQIKALALLAMLFVGSAGVGGELTQIGDYNTGYFLMVGSATFALLLSIFLFIKLRKSTLK